MATKNPDRTPKLRLVGHQEDLKPDSTVKDISNEMAERVFKGYSLDGSEFQGVGCIALELVLRNGTQATTGDVELAIQDSLAGLAKMGYVINFRVKKDGSNAVMVTAPNNKQIDKQGINTTLAAIFEDDLPYYFAIGWKKKS